MTRIILAIACLILGPWAGACVAFPEMPTCDLSCEAEVYFYGASEQAQDIGLTDRVEVVWSCGKDKGCTFSFMRCGQAPFCEPGFYASLWVWQRNGRFTELYRYLLNASWRAQTATFMTLREGHIANGYDADSSEFAAINAELAPLVLRMKVEALKALGGDNATQ